jgi:hypothetical protein
MDRLKLEIRPGLLLIIRRRRRSECERFVIAAACLSDEPEPRMHHDWNKQLDRFYYAQDNESPDRFDIFLEEYRIYERLKENTNNILI